MSEEVRFVTLTETAAKEIKKVIKDQELESARLRVGVRGGGCSGFEYSLTFDEEPVDEQKDVLDEQFDIPMVIDKKSALFLDGTTLDFGEELDQRGFKFENPNSTRTCGCGNSFSA